MTTPLAPEGKLAVESGYRETGAGRREASPAVMRVRFGRALQSDHADAFDTNVCGVSIDSAVDFPGGACTGATLRHASARAERLAALARR
ncbi:hypothetical protein [Caballeronia cordobensis]|uniref:hypothetical protein n=1 Tax=Caballeronia cordobensis TaxID=1353886 RepID=UPI0006AD8451|nr:hypothetical protein [Caballeronia cordobensis]